MYAALLLLAVCRYTAAAIVGVVVDVVFTRTRIAAAPAVYQVCFYGMATPTRETSSERAFESYCDTILA